MSYYPTERRGGCMESISRCCRQAYVYQIDTRKLLYAAGGVVGVILVAVVWSGLSSSDDNSASVPLKGRTVLQESPLIVGCNFFPTNLKKLVGNHILKVNFNENLKNDSVFGNEICKSCQTDLPRLKSGLVGSQIWSINVPCTALYNDAVSLTLEQIDAVTRLIDRYPDSLSFVSASNDINVDLQNHRLGSLLAVTSGHSFDGRLPVLRSLRKLGVRIMALTSSCSNAWAESYTTKNDVGLSAFGSLVVQEMNRLGILIDLSEASHQTRIAVLNTTKAPVVFSYAAAYNITNNPRNIRDDVLEKLKTNGGVVMVTFADQYISKTPGNSSISEVIEHISYIKKIAGATAVGIGGEFDAAENTYPSALSDVSSFPVLFDELGNNWNRDDLKKLAGGNFLRVLQAVEKYAKDSESLPADETYMLPSQSSCYSDYESRKNFDSSTTSSPSPTTSSPSPTTSSPSPTTSSPSPTTSSPSPTTSSPSPTTSSPSPTTSSPSPTTSTNPPKP